MRVRLDTCTVSIISIINGNAGRSPELRHRARTVLVTAPPSPSDAHYTHDLARAIQPPHPHPGHSVRDEHNRAAVELSYTDCEGAVPPHRLCRTIHLDLSIITVLSAVQCKQGSPNQGQRWELQSAGRGRRGPPFGSLQRCARACSAPGVRRENAQTAAPDGRGGYKTDRREPACAHPGDAGVSVQRVGWFDGNRCPERDARSLHVTAPSGRK